VIDDEPERKTTPEPVKPPTDQLGRVITNPKIIAAFSNRQLFTSFMREVSKLKADFRHLATLPGGEWAGRRVQQFDADVNNLHAALRFSIPHALCPYCGGPTCSQCKNARTPDGCPRTFSRSSRRGPRRRG